MNFLFWKKQPEPEPLEVAPIQLPKPPDPDPEPDLSSKPEPETDYVIGFACPDLHIRTSSWNMPETIDPNLRGACYSCGKVTKPAVIKWVRTPEWMASYNNSGWWDMVTTEKTFVRYITGSQKRNNNAKK